MARPVDQQPLFARLRALLRPGPLVVAHRGNSLAFPENTLPAFASAAELGAPVQEFDVQETADGHLVCLHDATMDRTTDAARTLGPGALVAQLALAQVRKLDAGAWKGAAHRGTRVPTLEEALRVMAPRSVPMIEHKAGHTERFVAALTQTGLLDGALVQSFDWAFVRELRHRCDRVALGLLGPTAAHARIDADVVAQAVAHQVGLVHWHAPQLTRAEIDLAHRHGLLVCTYTSDDELAWHGGRALGVDAMCSNDPAGMLASLAG